MQKDWQVEEREGHNKCRTTITPLCSPAPLLLPLHLEYCAVLWSSQHKKDVDMLESRGGHPDDKRVRTPLLQRQAERVGVDQPGKEKVSSTYKQPPSTYKKVEEHFPRACGDRPKGRGFK